MLPVATDDLATALRASIAADGETLTARRLGIAPLTLVRAVARLPMQRRTLDHIEAVVESWGALTGQDGAVPP